MSPQSTVPVEPLSAFLTAHVERLKDLGRYMLNHNAETSDYAEIGRLVAEAINDYPEIRRRIPALDAARASRPVTATALRERVRRLSDASEGHGDWLLGWQAACEHVLDILAALPVREDEPTGIDVERLRDEIAAAIWKGNPEREPDAFVCTCDHDATCWPHEEADLVIEASHVR